MDIGIIGAGELGSLLASKFVKLGHNVSIANSRGPASLKQLAGEIGAEATTVEEVTKNKEVIIVSLPQKSIRALPKDLFEQTRADVVVIETGNYYPTIRDGAIPALDQSGIDSLWVQEQLGFPIVKVFNSILATSIKDLGRPKGENDRIAIAVSGDSPKSKAVVFQLVDELGFDSFDIGTIAQSWKQQPGSSIYCRDIDLGELKKRVNAMGTAWSEMRDRILDQRTTWEALMAADYPAYLKELKD
ncbi:MAG: oxidoreductase [Mucilaginibacter sp.]|jgi:predicted dinucleotide-binding enzyme|nr:oxidoreductase [Mucilaginibacter sp.]